MILMAHLTNNGTVSKVSKKKITPQTHGQAARTGRHIPRAGTLSVSEHVRQCPALVDIRAVQMKTTVKYLFRPSR